MNNNKILNQPKYEIRELIINGDQLGDEFSCAICCDLIFKKEMLQCSNGHLYCKECWVESFKRKRECISCRVPIPSIQFLSRNRAIENLFLKNKAKCIYSFSQTFVGIDYGQKDENGCKEIIALENYDHHISNCSFKIVNCENTIYGCKERLRNGVLANHLAECRFRMDKCQYCALDILKCSMELHHSKNCLEKPIQCIYQCGRADIKRANMNNHCIKECSNTFIECKYKDGGCNKLIKRGEQYTHFQEIDHFNIASTIIEKNKNQINILKSLVQSASLLDYIPFESSIVIENFTQLVNLLDSRPGSVVKLKSEMLSLGPFQVNVHCSASKFSNQIILEYEENSFINGHCQFYFSLYNYKNSNFHLPVFFKDNKSSFELDRVNALDGWISESKCFRINFYLKYHTRQLINYNNNNNNNNNINK